MDETDKAIILKYFGIINKSIKDNEIGMKWAKVHLRPSPEQTAMGETELQTLRQMRKMFLQMQEDLENIPEECSAGVQPGVPNPLFVESSAV